jgi:hypothetical protein
VPDIWVHLRICVCACVFLFASICLLVYIQVSLTVSWQVRLGIGPPTRFLLLSDIYGLHVVGRPPWRENEFVIYLYNSLSCPSPAELMTTFCSLVLDSPNLEGQVPVFVSPRNRVAQMYSRALGSLFGASYDSQGYGGVILIRLHTGQCIFKIRRSFIQGAASSLWQLPYEKGILHIPLLWLSELFSFPWLL